MHFEIVELSESELAMRGRAREIAAKHISHDKHDIEFSTGGAHSDEFTKIMADNYLIGLAIAKEFGGHGRSPIERFVLSEELLAAGAPQRTHYLADRQSGPTIARFGTDEQRAAFIPGIVRGEVSFSVALSEPDAGSDLASVRTRASKVKGGWQLSGRKVWTSDAHRSDYALILVRTEPQSDDRHAGLSQFILDLNSPGIDIRPILTMDGRHHFNELVLDDVFVPDSRLLGEAGSGWQQVNSELSYERSGPDRFLTVFPILRAYVGERLTASPGLVELEAVGRLVSRVWALRLMSLSIARSLEQGAAPAVEAALVKDMGTTLEQQIVAELTRLNGKELDLDADSPFEFLLAKGVLASPTFTLRAGTTEIVRSVAARSLDSLTAGSLIGAGSDVEETVHALFRKYCSPDDVRLAEQSGSGWIPKLWNELEAGGFPLISVPEENGGSGGSEADALAMLRYAGRVAAPIPLAETGLLAGWLLAQAGFDVPSGPMTVVDASQHDLALTKSEKGWSLNGVASRVPWARVAEFLAVLLPCDGDQMCRVALVPKDAVTVNPGQNLAGEPRDVVCFNDVFLGSAQVRAASAEVNPRALRRRGALARTSQIAGALEAVAELTVRHASEREQFGRPLRRFQAVQQHLVLIAEEAACTAIAARAAALGDLDQDTVHVAAARVQAGVAVRTVCARAHQVHGAIGVCLEHPLQLLTRRMVAWIEEYGSPADWEHELGALVAEAGAEGLWPMIADGAGSGS